jgi:threonine synthase
MRYVSTRGEAPQLGFSDTVLAGLARDGGLYVPDAWPSLPVPVPSGSYAELAAAVTGPFLGGDLTADAWLAMCVDAYGSFRHAAVCPLVQVGDDDFLLELFHGPTLAFKDLALQLVGRLFDHVLSARGERVTVVGATSGDTGSAAIEAMRDRRNVDIVVLFPDGRVSDVQRRQMTAVDAPNVRAVAVDGTFDDCQDLVKLMFNDGAFRDRMRLSAVNSINWARVMAQIVYYVWAGRALGASATRPIRFSVPNGNFGNVLSGWVARQMGLPVRQLVIGSNTNDILTRLLAAGVMSVRDVVATVSPSMDIQVSSNFERLLFELTGRDGPATAARMAEFRGSGSLVLPPDELAAVRSVFAGARLDDDATLVEMAATYGETGVLIDPHTAVALAASRIVAGEPGVPTVTLATAHPAKFPDAVERATGVRPALPPHLADLAERPERFDRLPNDLAAVQGYVAAAFG